MLSYHEKLTIFHFAKEAINTNIAFNGNQKLVYSQLQEPFEEATGLKWTDGYKFYVKCIDTQIRNSIAEGFIKEYSEGVFVRNKELIESIPQEVHDLIQEVSTELISLE